MRMVDHKIRSRRDKAGGPVRAYLSGRVKEYTVVPVVLSANGQRLELLVTGHAELDLSYNPVNNTEWGSVELEVRTVTEEDGLDVDDEPTVWELQAEIKRLNGYLEAAIIALRGGRRPVGTQEAHDED